jgi:hypothetical protein
MFKRHLHMSMPFLELFQETVILQPFVRSMTCLRIPFELESMIKEKISIRIAHDLCIK